MMTTHCCNEIKFNENESKVSKVLPHKILLNYKKRKKYVFIFREKGRE